MENNIISNEDGICRTCLTKSNSLRSIYKSGKICGETTKLAIMLNFLTSLEFDQNDGLPNQICNKCVLQVSKAFTFKQQCLKSDSVLRQNIKKDLEVIDEEEEHSKCDENDRTTPTYLYEVNEDIIELKNVETVMENDEDKLTTEEDEGDVEKLVLEIDDNNGTYSLKIDKKEETDGDEELESDVPEIIFRKFRSRSKRGPQPPYKCLVCLKVLSNFSSYKYHMQLHSDNAPFLCSHCGQRFKTRNAYDGHMTTHNACNPHKCDICGKTYRQAASLRCHALTHSGEKPYLCGICGKGMTQKSGFKKHMLTHTGEKPHHCDICGKNFRYSSNLIMHKRSHTGLKPYLCNICDKRFPGGEQLKRHALIHTGEKPFSCEYCGKSFNRKSSLRVHRNIHTGEKKHSCKICDKSYIQLHCLTTHMKSHQNQ